MKNKLTMVHGLLAGLVIFVFTTAFDWHTNKGCCDQVDSFGHGFPLMYWGSYSGGILGRQSEGPGFFTSPFLIDLLVWLVLGQVIIVVYNFFAKRKIK